MKNTPRSIVVEPLAVFRQIMSKTLLENDIKREFFVSTIREAVDVLEVESDISIVFTRPLLDTKNSVFSLLELIANNKSLRNTYVVLMTNEFSDQDTIRLAYEKGILTHLDTSCSIVEFQKAVNIFSKSYHGQTQLDDYSYVSYLRFLIDNHHTAEAESFINKLVRTESPSFDIYCQWLEINHQQNKTSENVVLLSKMFVLFPEKQTEFPELARKFRITSAKDVGGKEINLNTAESPSTESRCLIVDKDVASVNACRKSLGKLGISKIDTAQSFEEAAQMVSANCYSLVVSEWMISGKTAEIFIQKLSNTDQVTMTMILSSLVDTAGAKLIGSLDGISVIAKPASDECLRKELAKLAFKGTAEVELYSAKQKIQALIKLGNLSNARDILVPLKDKFYANDELTLIEIELLIAEGEKTKAKLLIQNQIEFNGSDFKLLCLAGKLCIKLNDISNALVLFQKANESVPKNLSAMCAIASSYLDMGMNTHAANTAEKVLELDSELEAAAEIAANAAMGSGEQMSPNLLKNASVMRQLVGLHNNQAIGLSRNGENQEAQKLYEKATKIAVAAQQNHLLFSIHVNRAISYLRNNELAAAKSQIKEASKWADTPELEAKISRLKTCCQRTSNHYEIYPDHPTPDDVVMLSSAAISNLKYNCIGIVKARVSEKYRAKINQLAKAKLLFNDRRNDRNLWISIEKMG